MSHKKKLSATNNYKALGGVVLLTVFILSAGAFIFSSTDSGPAPSKDQIVSQKGLHWHPRLAIYIKGQKQQIPPDVGLGTVHQEIHTHEDITDDLIHMEMTGSVTKDETRLGNFFKIWGKDFSDDQIFEYKNGPEGKVKMYVNGSENPEFGNYEMKDKDIIEIKYE